MENRHFIDLVDISKEYAGEPALSHINLYLKYGEFVTLLGPSGCGKTTMLRIIAGFSTPSSGQVMMDGVDIAHVPPHKRRVNTVFQKYALFPHLNVFDNIAFGLRVNKKFPREEIAPRVNEMLHMVNLDGFGKRSVEQLSGGQQQRVAIARALVNEPEALLLDEPLGALDLKLRKGMQVELKKMQQKLGITFLYVTHDQEEALTMSDTVVVMNHGVIQQIGRPQDVYNEPKNVFVANFIGESNIISGVMQKDYLVRFNGRDYPCVDAGFGENTPVDVVLRPEDIDLVPPEQSDVHGQVQSILFMGVHYAIRVRCGEWEFMAQSTDAVEPGQTVGVVILPDAIHIMHKQEGGAV